MVYILLTLQYHMFQTSFKTLFKEPKHIEIWKFIKVTFSDDFVKLVDEQIKQSEIYGTNTKQD